MLRNWIWVYLGNLLGSCLYAFLFYAAITNFGSANGGALGDLVRQAAIKKTLGYAALGGGGMEHGVRQSRAVQLDGDRGNHAGFCFTLHGGQGPGDVAPHHNVFRARL